MTKVDEDEDYPKDNDINDVSSGKDTLILVDRYFRLLNTFVRYGELKVSTDSNLRTYELIAGTENPVHIKLIKDCPYGIVFIVNDREYNLSSLHNFFIVLHKARKPYVSPVGRNQIVGELMDFLIDYVPEEFEDE